MLWQCGSGGLINWSAHQRLNGISREILPDSWTRNFQLTNLLVTSFNQFNISTAVICPIILTISLVWSRTDKLLLSIEVSGLICGLFHFHTGWEELSMGEIPSPVIILFQFPIVIGILIWMWTEGFCQLFTVWNVQIKIKIIASAASLSLALSAVANKSLWARVYWLMRHPGD